MPIYKTSAKKYQVKIVGLDGNWITKVFADRRDAEAFDLKLKQEKQNGTLIPNNIRKMTLDEYFIQWFEDVRSQASPGWRKCQFQVYRDYISPILGNDSLMQIRTPMIAKVINLMADIGKSEQTQLHAFNLLRKMFGDAIEFYQYLSFNPVLRKLKPALITKEAPHLNMRQIVTLLLHVLDKDFGIAIWLQIYLGLRVNEVMALKWSDIDLEQGIVNIRNGFSRKDAWALQDKRKGFRDRPKGGKQHTNHLPPELLQFLKEAKEVAINEYVSPSPTASMMSYEYYLKRLKGYCVEIGIPPIGTHGLRHSTSELYQASGASRDDLRELFAHSSTQMTDRYVHGKSRVSQVAGRIRVLPGGLSTKFPRNAV